VKIVKREKKREKRREKKKKSKKDLPLPHPPFIIYSQMELAFR
jgi:hypothetical protein